MFSLFGIIPKSEPDLSNLTFPKNSKFYKDTRYPISAEDMYVISVNDPEYYRDNSHLYKVTGKLNIKAGVYNKKIEDPTILRHMTGYHNNTLIEDEKLGYSAGNLVGYIAGYKILNRVDAYIYKKSNPSLVSDNKAIKGEQLLLENKVNSVQGKVFINNGTPGGTTIAHQIRFTGSSGNMITLQNNLTTRERLFQVINPSGQLIYEKSLTPYPASALIGTSSNFQILVGNGAVSQVTSKLLYNPVLKLPVKYPNLTDSENKFLNDYIGKEIPGEIVSKYNDVNKYEYNATTNPALLAEVKIHQ